MNNEKKHTETQTADQIDVMTEVHEAELDSIAGALMTDCPKWPNTSKSWGF